MSTPKQVLVDAATFAFFVHEAEMVHVLCDRAAVPRVIDGTDMSMAQRVAILEGCWQGLLSKFTTRPDIPLH